MSQDQRYMQDATRCVVFETVAKLLKIMEGQRLATVKRAEPKEDVSHLHYLVSSSIWTCGLGAFVSL